MGPIWGPKTAQKAGLEICPKNCFFANNMDKKWLQGAPLRQVPLKPCGHEPIVFQKGNPQVCQMLRIHGLRCHHTFRFPQCCPAVNAVTRIIKVVEIFGSCFAPIANLRQQTRQTSMCISCIDARRFVV